MTQKKTADPRIDNPNVVFSYLTNSLSTDSQRGTVSSDGLSAPITRREFGADEELGFIFLSFARLVDSFSV